jgi:predicted aminopeptidase
MRYSRILVILLFLMIFSGCSQVAYYAQSMHGQLDVWRRGHSIDELIDAPTTAGSLRDRLTLALKIREFASRELALPDNGSYRRYADLERPFVVWNVFAAPEFSVEPAHWCFAFIGCVNYRGYFSKLDADNYASEAAAQGHDVHVGGVPAYSTLGWFDDPVLNTFVNYPEVELARLIFHELAHQIVYVKDDSVFNESFATAVEGEGVRRWIARHGSVRDRDIFDQRSRYRADFRALIARYRERLGALYAKALVPDDKRIRKVRMFDEMKRDYVKLKIEWGGYAGYDRWFAQPPNNALLASVFLYTQQVPAFRALIEKHRHDLPRFFVAVKQLARLGKNERDIALRSHVLPTASRL